MKIDVRNFPLEGLHLEGETPATPYDLPPEVFLDPEPFRFSFRVELAGPEFLVTGQFSLRFQVACSRCLEPIPWTIRIDSFAASFPSVGLETIDLTDRIREDTLLALPMAPGCVLDAEQRCPVTGASFRDKGSDPFAEQHRIETWEALNQFNQQQP